MSDKELAEIISNHLPIGIDDAENLVDSIQKAYTWGNIDYAMALSARDGVIKNQAEQIKRLKNILDKLKS